MPSGVEQAQIDVRDWTEPVQIYSPVATQSSPHRGSLTLTMGSEAGATIWYTLEPSDHSTLCDARAQAASIAPNLTLAADAEWSSVINTEPLTTGVCQGDDAIRCKSQPMSCW